MRCPFCNHADSKVVDSRDSETGEAIRRRRECLSCTKRFTTYERVDAVPLYVVKKDGRREEFNRQKLIGGLILASKKRDIAPTTLERLVDDVENELRSRNTSEVKASEIGTAVMPRLREIDEIAYVRFASVYRSFKDVEQMRITIEEMLSNPPGQRDAAPRRKRRKSGDGSELSLDLDK